MAKYLRPIRPNAGTAANYEKRLTALIDEMHRSIVYWVGVAYRANTPEIAQDASPAAMLRDAINRLRKRWVRKFAELAPKLATRFVSGATGGTDRAMLAALRDAGFTVRFKTTAAINDMLQAKIAENVGLIKSIPAQHFDRIEGMVMRSVQAGRDIGGLTRELEDAFGVTRRRAALIARDQNNKATAVIQRARQIEMNLFESIWIHSGGGKHPRPSHVKFSGQTFDIRTGAYIDGEYIQPGEKIGCRCVSKIKLPMPGK